MSFESEAQLAGESIETFGHRSSDDLLEGGLRDGFARGERGRDELQGPGDAMNGRASLGERPRRRDDCAGAERKSSRVVVTGGLREMPSDAEGGANLLRLG